MLPNADGPKLYAGVGFSGNITENGMEAAGGPLPEQEFLVAAFGDFIGLPPKMHAVAIVA